MSRRPRPSRSGPIPGETGGTPGWLELTVEVERARADEVTGRLEALGCDAVTMRDAADDPLYEPGPGETPLWARTEVTGLFPDSADADAIVAALSSAFPARALGRPRLRRLADRAWEREWLRHYRPTRFGRRLWVGPRDTPAPAGAAAVHLDPGLAFGTGTHPSTALCLEWLDDVDPVGLDVVDYGCGSGILACAAAALGAARVRAVDIDPQALAATRENARHNDVAGCVNAIAPEALGDEPGDVLVANILADVLVELAPRLTALVRPGGRIALAGVLDDQADRVESAFAPWMDPEPRAGRDGWTRLGGRRTARRI